VHLADFPAYKQTLIDKSLEERMALAQQISSMALALRRKVNIKVRQPLSKIIIPVLDASLESKLEKVKQLILNEINVKELEFLTDTTGILVKKIKPNFKTLGPRYGKQMKEISAAIAAFTQQDIANFERSAQYNLILSSGQVDMTLEDVEISSEDIPGWLVSTEGQITVALDINITEELRREGIARELINRIQNIRKESNFDVTDKINITFEAHPAINDVINDYKLKNYIAGQTLAININWGSINNAVSIDLDEENNIRMSIEKL
jgi:isoleucyl-tRNA synthetase